MTRFSVFAILVAALAACTSTPLPAAPSPSAAVATDGSDPCLDELLKSAEEKPEQAEAAPAEAPAPAE